MTTHQAEAITKYIASYSNKAFVSAFNKLQKDTQRYVADDRKRLLDIFLKEMKRRTFQPKRNPLTIDTKGTYENPLKYGHGAYEHRRLGSPSRFDPRSFRTKTLSHTKKLIVGCPKGHYSPSTGTCRTGMKAQAELTLKNCPHNCLGCGNFVETADLARACTQRGYVAADYGIQTYEFWVEYPSTINSCSYWTPNPEWRRDPLTWKGPAGLKSGYQSECDEAQGNKNPLEGERDPYKCNWAFEAARAKKWSDSELFYAMEDAKKAMEAGANYGKYVDQLSVYMQERNCRMKRKNPLTFGESADIVRSSIEHLKDSKVHRSSVAQAFDLGFGSGLEEAKAITDEAFPIENPRIRSLARILKLPERSILSVFPFPNGSGWLVKTRRGDFEVKRQEIKNPRGAYDRFQVGNRVIQVMPKVGTETEVDGKIGTITSMGSKYTFWNIKVRYDDGTLATTNKNYLLKVKDPLLKGQLTREEYSEAIQTGKIISDSWIENPREPEGFPESYAYWSGAFSGLSNNELRLVQRDFQKDPARFTDYKAVEGIIARVITDELKKRAMKNPKFIGNCPVEGAELIAPEALAMEYKDIPKAKREGVQNPNRPWRHDFTAKGTKVWGLPDKRYVLLEGRQAIWKAQPNTITGE